MAENAPTGTVESPILRRSNGAPGVAPRHKVVTVERGTTADGRRGFAARCETEGCGEITFGGFVSRTAARAALAGHDGQATR